MIVREEIVLGTNIPSRFNSVCMWCGSDVSQNSEFYIITEDITGIRLYLYKASEIGNAFGEWISREKNRNNALIQQKALEYILPHLTVEEFYEVIEKEKNHAWQSGYSQAKCDIREVLEL